MKKKDIEKQIEKATIKFKLDELIFIPSQSRQGMDCRVLEIRNVKEKIQNAQKKLKGINFKKRDFRVINEIDKIFLEEFGDKLIEGKK